MAKAKKKIEKKPAKAAAKKPAVKEKKAAAPKAAAPKPAAPKKAPKVRKATKPKNEKTLSYSQSEFIENLRGFCGLDKRSQAKELCEDISLFIKDSLRKGYRLPLMGLGKLYVRRTKPRMGRNPATGETIQIPSRKRVRFVPAKSLKEAVL